MHRAWQVVCRSAVVPGAIAAPQFSMQASPAVDSALPRAADLPCAQDQDGGCRMAKEPQRLPPEARRTLKVLFAATIVFTLGDGSMQILLAPYLEQRGLEQVVIGQVVSAYSVAALGFRFIAGFLYRPHRTVWLVPGGCALQALAFLLVVRTGDPVLLTCWSGSTAWATHWRPPAGWQPSW